MNKLEKNDEQFLKTHIWNGCGWSNIKTGKSTKDKDYYGCDKCENKNEKAKCRCNIKCSHPKCEYKREK